MYLPRQLASVVPHPRSEHAGPRKVTVHVVIGGPCRTVDGRTAVRCVARQPDAGAWQPRHRALPEADGDIGVHVVTHHEIHFGREHVREIHAGVIDGFAGERRHQVSNVRWRAQVGCGSGIGLPGQVVAAGGLRRLQGAGDASGQLVRRQRTIGGQDHLAQFGQPCLRQLPLHVLTVCDTPCRRQPIHRHRATLD